MADNVPDNPTAMRATARIASFLSILVTASMGVLPLLPDEHVHDVTTEEGHHTLVTHRHLEPHQVGQHHAGTTLDHLDPEIVHDSVYTAPPKTALGVPAAIVSTQALPAPARVATIVRDVPRVPIHGPPRAPCHLRAPPSRPA
jgi:hypothetical protein